MEAVIVANHHRWGVGALAAGALGMFLAALLADWAAWRAGQWTVTVDAKGGGFTRTTP